MHTDGRMGLPICPRCPKIGRTFELLGQLCLVADARVVAVLVEHLGALSITIRAATLAHKICFQYIFATDHDLAQFVG